MISEMVNNMYCNTRYGIYSQEARLDLKGLNLMCSFAGPERHECKQEEPWSKNFA